MPTATTSHKQKQHGKSEPAPGLNNPRGNNICAHHQSTAACAHEDSRGKLSCDGTCCANQLPAALLGADRVKTLCGQAGPDQKPAVAKKHTDAHKLKTALQTHSATLRADSSSVAPRALSEPPAPKTQKCKPSRLANTHRQRQAAGRCSGLRRCRTLRNTLHPSRLCQPAACGASDSARCDDAPSVAKPAVTKPVCDQAGLCPISPLASTTTRAS